MPLPDKNEGHGETGGSGDGDRALRGPRTSASCLDSGSRHAFMKPQEPEDWLCTGNEHPKKQWKPTLALARPTMEVRSPEPWPAI